MGLVSENIKLNNKDDLETETTEDDHEEDRTNKYDNNNRNIFIFISNEPPVISIHTIYQVLFLNQKPSCKDSHAAKML